MKTDRDRLYSWQEIRQHTTRESRWLVIDDGVYDVTRWAYKHPGGSRLLGHYSGQDASEPYKAFHLDSSQAGKYLKAYKIGHVNPEDPDKRSAMRKDFEELRQKVRRLGLFTPSVTFYTLMFVHLFVLEALAYFTIRTYGTGWVPWLVAIAFYATAQSQASWLQHDFGHLSVFPSKYWNDVLHQITMSFFKAASANWWKHLHYQHHAKPNVMEKDPDVRLQPVFVVGKTMPKEIIGDPKFQFKYFTIPYNFQHRYFLVIGPPLLFPVYFQITTVMYAVSRRCYQDMFWMTLFFVKLFVLYKPYLGIFGALFYYFLVRMVESHWFTWVSQMNHIPMEIEHDREEPWLELQLHATCDVEKSAFNDWFTGHLNFQIEHHLFPTMPRHNYYKVQPYVLDLCRKYGIKHEIKPLWTAFMDILNSLRSSGEIWFAAYHAHHM